MPGHLRKKQPIDKPTIVLSHPTKGKSVAKWVELWQNKWHAMIQLSFNGRVKRSFTPAMDFREINLWVWARNNIDKIKIK